MNRRSFLKCVLATAAASQFPVSFALESEAAPIILVMMPYKLAMMPYKPIKEYNIKHSAEIWTITTTVGQVIGGKAIMNKRLYYSQLVSNSFLKDSRADYLDYFTINAIKSLDHLLTETYGKYTPISINEKPLGELVLIKKPPLMNNSTGEE